jgi:predicted ribosome quality control (RQC) complex YloA/Tae2 family protein
VKPLDTLVILALSRQVGPQIDGGRLEAVDSIGRDRLRFTIRKDDRFLHLIFDLEANCPCFYLTVEKTSAGDHLPPAWRTQLDRLVNARIKAVAPATLERLFYLAFDLPARIGPKIERRLVIELIPGRANLLVLGADGKIITAWRHPKVRGRDLLPGTLYREPTFGFDLLTADREEAVNRLRESGEPGGDPAAVLRDAFPQLPPRPAGELVSLLQETRKAEMVVDRIERWLGRIGRTDNPCRLYSPPGEEPFLSAVRLDEDRYGPPERFDTVSDALEVGLREDRGVSDLERARQTALSRLNRLRKKRRALAQKQGRDADRSGRWQEYKRFADLLSAQIYLVDRGAGVARVKDLYGDPETEVEIPLKAKLSPGQNVKRYVELARKGERGEQRARERFQATVAMNARLDQALRTLTETTDLNIIDGILRDFPGVEAARPPRKGTDPGSKLAAGWGIKPHRFRTTGGFLLLVGKSARENDVLVTKVAAPWDLWFHVRGAGGAHVILVRPDRKTRPPKTDIEQAAALAAHFSKQRGAGRVPVDFCEKRHLRKPKGAPPGAVLLGRSESIMVEPGLPPDGD